MPHPYSFFTSMFVAFVFLASLCGVSALPPPAAPADRLSSAIQAGTDQTVLEICPPFVVRCVVNGEWRHPVAYLGKRDFCLNKLRCDQCEAAQNTEDCNADFPELCHGRCEAYGPLPF